MAGVDLIFFETFLDADELLLALEVKQSLHHLPALCSLACAEEGRLPSGLPITEAFAQLTAAGAEIVGVNCLNGPHATLRLLEHVPVVADQLLAAFPNAGYPQYHEGRFLYYTAPDYFAKVARDMASQGARLIGGCCGTGPAQIAAMAAALRDLAPVTSKPAVRPIEPPPAKHAPAAAKSPVLVPAVSDAPPAAVAGGEEVSILDRIAQGKTVVITELDPPKTLDLEKFLAGAQGVDRRRQRRHHACG